MYMQEILNNWFDKSGEISRFKGGRRQYEEYCGLQLWVVMVGAVVVGFLGGSVMGEMVEVVVGGRFGKNGGKMVPLGVAPVMNSSACRDPSDERIVDEFLADQGIDESKSMKISNIIKRMGKYATGYNVLNGQVENGMVLYGFKEELGRLTIGSHSIEFGIVQDADRLDAIGAIGIARCFTFGGSRNRVLHNPTVLPRSDLSKEQYMNKDEQTTVNHFHEKLLKLKNLMKTKAGQRRAELRHKFMEDFLEEFYKEWDGKA
ncbi:hypothetical protein RJ639_039443 [Escallonia herrerae]|uniref:Uncharacterized protein n=1 Tax=Escallonia herrerae TaxID=1293975 RepID=A0AA88WSI2_9ASTE|nr:hypothetical protein RJ639_039443 [Escallonia herrerae]